MRLAIKGTEVSVVVTALRDLSTQEIIAAQQLATGNFEALFVKENEENEATSKLPTNTFDDIGADRTTQIEFGDRCKVDVACSGCGYEGEYVARYGNSYTKCPGCGQKLRNQSASGTFGIPTKGGYMYIAMELYMDRKARWENEQLLAEMGEVTAD